MKEFKHKKSLGQNFLKNEKVLDNITNIIALTDKDLVIEIGPGHGALTRKLQRTNVNLLCYEIDKRTKPYLDKIVNSKTNIIYCDFLTADIEEQIKNQEYENIYVIANIPYYITTPIIKKIINSKTNIKQIVLMVQDEVADRFSAKAHNKDYSQLTVYIATYYNVTKLFKVDKHDFNPVPEVDSAIISLLPNDNLSKIDNLSLYFELINDSFRQKRKNLKNNLKKYDLDIIDSVLTKHGLNLQNRAEDIEIDIYIEIANKLNSYITKI